MVKNSTGESQNRQPLQEKSTECYGLLATLQEKDFMFPDFYQSLQSYFSSDIYHRVEHNTIMTAPLG